MVKNSLLLRFIYRITELIIFKLLMTVFEETGG